MKEELQKAMYEISAKLYQNAAPNAENAANVNTGNENTNESADTGNVYNADFKDVDNN